MDQTRTGQRDRQEHRHRAVQKPGPRHLVHLEPRARCVDRLLRPAPAPESTVQRNADVRRSQPRAHRRAALGHRGRIRPSAAQRTRVHRGGRQGERQDRVGPGVEAAHAAAAARIAVAPLRELHVAQQPRAGGGEAVRARAVHGGVPRRGAAG